jgi:hypothetical protein
VGAEKDGVVTDATKLNGEDVAQAESPSTNGLEPEVGESDLATVPAMVRVGDPSDKSQVSSGK